MKLLDLNTIFKKHREQRNMLMIPQEYNQQSPKCRKLYKTNPGFYSKTKQQQKHIKKLKGNKKWGVSTNFERFKSYINKIDFCFKQTSCFFFFFLRTTTDKRFGETWTLNVDVFMLRNYHELFWIWSWHCWLFFKWRVTF